MTTSTEAPTEASQQKTDGIVTEGAESETPPIEAINQAPDDGDVPGDGLLDADADVPLDVQPAGKPEEPAEAAAVEDVGTGDGIVVSAPEALEDAPVFVSSDAAEVDDVAAGADAEAEISLEAALKADESGMTDDAAEVRPDDAAEPGDVTDIGETAVAVEGAAAGEDSADEEDTGLLPDGLTEEGENCTVPAEDSAPSREAAPAPCAEASSQEAAGTNAEELTLILAALEKAAARADGLTARIDGIAADVGNVTDQLYRISGKYEMVSSEIDSVLADNNRKSILSKTFLLISSVTVAVLAAFQVYTFAGLVSTQRQLNLSGRSVIENVAALSKKMAEYDKNLAKALESSSMQVPARHDVAESAAVPAEKAGHKEVANAAGSVQERMNRLRNGLPERRVIRKETGDWFVLNNKKAEECIVDAEVMEVLNNAYRRSGRPLTTKMPLPPHNSLCLLKPDGKGGTEVVMTKDFVQ